MTGAFLRVYRPPWQKSHIMTNNRQRSPASGMNSKRHQNSVHRNLKPQTYLFKFAFPPKNPRRPIIHYTIVVNFVQLVQYDLIVCCCYAAVCPDPLLFHILPCPLCLTVTRGRFGGMVVGTSLSESVEMFSL